MLEKSNKSVLFINGINIKNGGANKRIVEEWSKELSNEFDRVLLFHIDPWFISRESAIKSLFSFFWYLPGSLFRLFQNPIFEYLYKLSPFTLISFSVNYIIFSPDIVIFSHHSVFYLSLFVPKRKRIYIVHDSLYEKSNLPTTFRIIKKLNIYIEILILSKGYKVCFLSYRENKIFKGFLSNESSLIRIIASELVPYSGKYDLHDIAIIGDWRRSVNLNSLIKFFDTFSYRKQLSNNKLCFTIYGLGSVTALNKLKKYNTHGLVRFIDGGIYKNLKDVTQGIVLAPIYEGAGIKMKVIESLINSRVIIGTDLAFRGIPRSYASNQIYIVKTLKDLFDLSEKKITIQSVDFHIKYYQLYDPISKVIKSVST